MSIAKDNTPDSANTVLSPVAEKVVTANKFILIDSDGKERISLTAREGIAMIALYDSSGEPCLMLAVTPEGSTMISAPYRRPDGDIDDSFRLIVSNGEPELILHDAIFKNTTVVSARGLCPSEQMM